MVVRLLDWNRNISCLVINLSKGPMLELGGVASIRVGLGQYASMELGKLGLATTISDFPSMICYICLSTFLVA